MITAFVTDRESLFGKEKRTDWNYLAEKYYDDYINHDNVDDSRIVEIGFSPTGFLNRVSLFLKIYV